MNTLVVVAFAVVALDVVSCSFSEQRVLVERHLLPNLIMFFLSVKFEVIGAELSPTRTTFGAGTFI